MIEIVHFFLCCLISVVVFGAFASSCICTICRCAALLMCFRYISSLVAMYLMMIMQSVTPVQLCESVYVDVHI